MKKLLFHTIFILLLSIPLNLFSQTSEGGLPPSIQSKFRSAVAIPSFGLKTIRVSQLLNEDNANGISYRYGVLQTVTVDLKANGVKTQVDSGSIWQYKIQADSAKSIKLFFSKFNIPQGAKLFVYNPDYSTIFGAYTNANVTSDSSFVVGDFPGNELIIEYYEPSQPAFSGTVILSKVSQAYRDLAQVMSSSTSTEDSLYVDVNCGGQAWQVQKHAVCMYTFTDDSSSYLCSGALINNINKDGTPYFLTAHHCVSSSASASSVVAYFNYETKGCGLAAKAYSSLSGATLISTGTNSDYTLLEFTSTPKPSYQPYYAGWDLTNSATSTVGIHHPAGYKKKISFDYDAPTTYAGQIAWDQGGTSPANTHWLVYFDKGHIGGGSSGSPLFNQNKRIIGQLHGGGTTDSYYGKLNYSWTHYDNGYSSLKTYLAGGKDSTYLSGYFPSTNPPDASFSSNYTKVCTGAPITFTDHSAFNVTSWKWTFSPSSVTFLDSTSSTSENPKVNFNSAGIYTVTLIVGNVAGNDTVSSTITVGSTLSLSYESTPSSGSCLSAADSVVVTASGASKFTWKLDSASSVYFNIDTLTSSLKSVIKQNSSVSIDSTVSVTGIYVGTQGTCVDTASFNITLEKPSNDDIANAKLITVGTNGPFTNECATVETGEPKPAGTSCYSQKAWCNETGSGSVLNNTVWFYFYGPSSGAVSIEADSIDGQIALYSADSYQDILKNNYTLLAANDDISYSNTNSRITSVAVTSGKKYWLQFDGSNDGATGTFYIKLESVNSSTTTTTDTSSIVENYVIYPNPATTTLTVKGAGLKGLSKVDVKLFNCFGKEIYNQQLTVLSDKIIVPLDNIPDGLYLISMKGVDTSLSRIFIKTKQ